MITADPAHRQLVAAGGADPRHPAAEGDPHLARGGARRAQTEGVRVAASARGADSGEAPHLGDRRGRRQACGLVQLTSDERRPEAHRLDERLGFIGSHEGFKLDLG